MGIPVTQLHCAPCGLARGQSLDQTRKFKMGPKTFKNSTQLFSTKKPYLLPPKTEVRTLFHKFFTANILFWEDLGVACFRPKNQSFL